MVAEASREKGMCLFLSIPKASIHFSNQNYIAFVNLLKYSNWAEQYCITVWVARLTQWCSWSLHSFGCGAVSLGKLCLIFRTNIITFSLNIKIVSEEWRMFNCWRWDSHAVLKHRTQITQWYSATYQKKGDHIFIKTVNELLQIRLSSQFPEHHDVFQNTINECCRLKLLWLTLTQVQSSCEIEFLPVYNPSEEEKRDPKLYANNVRHLMAKYVEFHSQIYVKFWSNIIILQYMIMNHPPLLYVAEPLGFLCPTIHMMIVAWWQKQREWIYHLHLDL